MKITICGKGGCGKSTVTTLLAKELARMGKKVLVVDSDESNFGLHRQLGVELPRDFTEYFGGKDKAFKTMMTSGILKLHCWIWKPVWSILAGVRITPWTAF